MSSHIWTHSISLHRLTLSIIYLVGNVVTNADGTISADFSNGPKGLGRDRSEAQANACSTFVKALPAEEKAKFAF